jgi:hypothetical protein
VAMVSDMLLVEIHIYCKHVRTEDGGAMVVDMRRHVDKN